MNEKVWHDIMKEYIQSYECIKFLHDKGVLDYEDEYLKLLTNLLDSIIATFESEVEE